MVIIKVMYHLLERRHAIQQKCCSSKCENESTNKLITPMFISHDKLMEILGVKQTVEINQPFVLCGKCYNETYATIYGSHNGATPKSSKAFVDTAWMLIIFGTLATRHAAPFLTH